MNEITVREEEFKSLVTSKTVQAVATIAKQKPYEMKVFDEEKIHALSTKLAEVDRAIHTFGRSNSQATSAFMTLTMLNGQSPYRILRQCLAEIEKKRNAIAEAAIKLAKNRKKYEESTDDLKRAELFARINSTTQHIEGALKDIAFYTDAAENIKKTHNIPDNWDEEDFESKEPWHHIRRGFEMLYRNLVENGRIHEVTMEYLNQFGVHAQTALVVVRNYISDVDKMISEGQFPDSQHFEDFLDACADKFEPEHKKVVQRMFGTDEYTNKEYMFLENKLTDLSDEEEDSHDT